MEYAPRACRRVHLLLRFDSLSVHTRLCPRFDKLSVIGIQLLVTTIEL